MQMFQYSAQAYATCIRILIGEWCDNFAKHMYLSIGKT